MTRKTIKVERVLDLANAYLAESGDSRARERLGVAQLLELVLHDSGAYAGYLHHKPGVWPNIDDTRRTYLRHHKL